MINHLHNRNFFNPQYKLRNIGIWLLGAGFVLYLILSLAQTLTLLATPLLLAGVVCVVISYETAVTEDDLQDQITKRKVQFQQEIENKYYDVKRPLPKLKVQLFGGYLTEGEGLLTRRTKTGRLITSRYHLVLLGTKSNHLYLEEEIINLVEEKSEQKSQEFPFYEVCRTTLVPNDMDANRARFQIFDYRDRCLLDVQVPNDYEMQKLSEQLNIDLAKQKGKGPNAVPAGTEQ